MKKVLSLTLALLMVLAIPCTASATEATSELIIESFSLDEVIKAPSVTIGDDELVTTVSSGDQEMIIESFPLEEITQAPSLAVYDGSTLAFNQFSFDGCTYNAIWSDMIEYTMSEGETGVLEITTCIWTPTTNTLYIGFYNVDTATGYAYPFTGGSASGTYSWPDLPVGQYIVYVRNMSSRTITDGTMRYNVG